MKVRTISLCSFLKIKRKDIMEGMFYYLSDSYNYGIPASLDTETGYVTYEAKERTNWNDPSSKGVFKDVEIGEEYTLCPDCHEYILKTVIGDRADLSYGEYTICNNPNCSYNS